MPGDKELDTKEEIALEEAKIELEKKKADLWKHRFDTYLAIARDLGLIIVIVATTWFNIMSGKAPKAALEMHSPGGAGSAGSPVDMAVSSPAPLLDFLNMHTGLWVLVILAVVFLILPRLKKKNKEKPQ